MLHSLLISPDEQLNLEFLTALKAVPGVEESRVLTAYPRLEDLLRTIRVRKIDLLFLCVEDLASIENLAASLDDLMPGLAIITLGRGEDPQLVRKLMHLGIREHLSHPIKASVLAEAIQSVERYQKKHPGSVPQVGDLYTFFPAKPGVGTSTIAVGVSCALADNLGTRALLLDCDLAAGAIKFLLKLENSSSIVDAIRQASNIDEDMWGQMVGKWDGLDVLHAGGLNLPASFEPAGLEQVLAMARSQYQVICADLASSMDSFSIALLRESRRIFMVTTPEVVPLYLATDRMRYLGDLGLGDRVSLVLNRKNPRAKYFRDEEVAQIVGIPVTHSLGNDYPGVQQSIIAGHPVSHSSDLGQSILELAQSLVPTVGPKEASHHRKFLEFFHVSPTPESDVVWRD